MEKDAEREKDYATLKKLNFIRHGIQKAKKKSRPQGKDKAKNR